MTHVSTESVPRPPACRASRIGGVGTGAGTAAGGSPCPAVTWGAPRGSPSPQAPGAAGERLGRLSRPELGGHRQPGPHEHSLGQTRLQEPPDPPECERKFHPAAITDEPPSNMETSPKSAPRFTRGNARVHFKHRTRRVTRFVFHRQEQLDVRVLLYFVFLFFLQNQIMPLFQLK